MLCSRRGVRFRHVHDKIEVPAFAGILTETAAFDRAGEFTAFPESERVTRIANGIPSNLDAYGFERNPAGRTPSASAAFFS